MSKKEIKGTRGNLKGRDVLPICRMCVEAGVPATINTVSIINQKNKGEEARTKKRKRINEAVATGRRVPRKKK